MVASNPGQGARTFHGDFLFRHCH